MSRWTKGAVTGLALLLGVLAASPARGESVQTRLLLKGKRTMDVTISGRNKDWIRVDSGDVTQQVKLPVGDVQRMAFRFDKGLEKKAREYYAAGNYKAVNSLLAAKLKMAITFLDVPNNGYDLVSLLVCSRYWAGDYAGAEKLAARFMAATTLAPYHGEAAVFRALALLALDRDEEAGAVLADMPEPGVDVAWGAPYWYARARLAMKQHDWSAANEYTGRLVALYGRDHEWLPVGLYLSARLQRKFLHHEVAAQVVREMMLVYPDSPWTARARRLKKDFPIPEVKNAGFEAGGDGPGAPPDWNASRPEAAGVTSADDEVALADNGVIPEGEKVAFIRTSGGENTLSQPVDGFQVGHLYVLTFRENARAESGADEQGPFLTVFVDGIRIVREHLVKPVDRQGRHDSDYRLRQSKPFKALKTTHGLRFVVSGPGEERTVLLDEVAIYDADVLDTTEKAETP